MNGRVEKYRAIRRKFPAYPANAAWQWAASLQGDDVEFGEVFQQDGFDVRVTFTYDDSPDSSYLGTFSDDQFATSIKNPEAWSDGERTNHRVYAWFTPANDPEEERNFLNGRYGQAKHAAWLESQRHVIEAMESLRNYTAYGLTVSVSREGVELGGDSLWGIDVSDDWRLYGDVEHQLSQVLKEHGMIDEAIHNAKATLGRLVASEAK